MSQDAKKDEGKKQKQDRANLIKPGMTVKVYEKIKELDTKGNEKIRTQVFEGIILAVKRPRTTGATFIIRKDSEGIGVEKVYPLHSPLIEKIVPVKQAKVRRAKLYYLRGHKKHLQERKI